MAVIDTEITDEDVEAIEFASELLRVAVAEKDKQSRVVARFPQNTLALRRHRILVEGLRVWEQAGLDCVPQEFTDMLYALANQEVGKLTQVVKKNSDDTDSLRRLEVLLEGVRVWNEAIL